MNNKNIIIYFTLGVIILILLSVVLKSSDVVTEKPLVTNFEECKNAGYPIMESYPAQCRDASGQNFVEIVNNPTPTPDPVPTPTPVVSGGCFVGGCSGQICSDKEDVISTCEYREEYACYRTAKCARQTNGKCAWTQTSALSLCINSSTSIKGYVSGHVNIGPFCPVESANNPCAVPPGAYTSREVVIYLADKITVKGRMNLDVNGNYNVLISPGNYYVQIDPAGIGPGEKKFAVVKSSLTTVVNFDIDTGIR